MTEISTSHEDSRDPCGYEHRQQRIAPAIAGAVEDDHTKVSLRLLPRRRRRTRASRSRPRQRIQMRVLRRFGGILVRAGGAMVPAGQGAQRVSTGASALLNQRIRAAEHATPLLRMVNMRRRSVGCSKNSGRPGNAGASDVRNGFSSTATRCTSPRVSEEHQGPPYCPPTLATRFGPEQPCNPPACSVCCAGYGSSDALHQGQRLCLVGDTVPVQVHAADRSRNGARCAGNTRAHCRRARCDAAADRTGGIDDPTARHLRVRCSWCRARPGCRRGAAENLAATGR